MSAAHVVGSLQEPIWGQLVFSNNMTDGGVVKVPAAVPAPFNTPGELSFGTRRVVRRTIGSDAFSEFVSLEHDRAHGHVWSPNGDGIDWSFQEVGPSQPSLWHAAQHPLGRGYLPDRKDRAAENI